MNIEAKDGQNEDLGANLTQAVETEIRHFERGKSFGRASQHNRNVDLLTILNKNEKLLNRYGLDVDVSDSTLGSTRNIDHIVLFSLLIRGEFTGLLFPNNCEY